MVKIANTQKAGSGKAEYYVGIDIGGTFTDGILIDEQGRVHHFKTPSVPANQAGYEIAIFRVDAVGKTKKPDSLTLSPAGPDPSHALKGQRQVFFQGSLTTTNIYAGEKLTTGNVIAGPGIVEYVDTTAVINANMSATVDPYLNLILRSEDIL